jgi:hypothetical protein
MWIMVEPVAEIPFGIHWSPTWCYGCNIHDICLHQKSHDYQNTNISKHSSNGSTIRFGLCKYNSLASNVIIIKDWYLL